VQNGSYHGEPPTRQTLVGKFAQVVDSDHSSESCTKGSSPTVIVLPDFVSAASAAEVSDPEYGQRCWTPMTCGRWLSRGSTGSLFSPLTKCLVFENQSKRGSRTARTRHRTDYLKHHATCRSREAIGRAKLLWRFTSVRIVLHGLRRSRLVDRRLGGQTTGSRGICHLLGEYSVARPVRLQRRPVS
jgi:hypothetical protein